METDLPSAAVTVTVAVPVLNEEAHIEKCLDAIRCQTYQHLIEILVVDGGSTDRTVALAQSHPLVRVIDNPRRIQAAALNIALDAAKGSVLVRVDGHTIIAPDYVERCVAALAASGAALVGGGMTPVAEGWRHAGIAAAMRSIFGAGPAAFHGSTVPQWTDTVYLGAFTVETGRNVGGYRETSVNEDAELAIRLAPAGGVWYDPSIRSTYVPRATYWTLGRQFYLYGKGRAATVRRHPRSLSPRQLAAPALVVGMASPWRRWIAGSYAIVLVVAAVDAGRWDLRIVPGFVVALPVMHLTWGIGFFVGLLSNNGKSNNPQARRGGTLSEGSVQL